MMTETNDPATTKQDARRRRGRTPTIAIAALGFLFMVYGLNATLRQIFYYVLPSMVE
jgi:hypothetical protein